MTDKNLYIQKFKELYKQKEGRDISDQEALEYLEKLLTLVEAIYKPLPRKFFEDGSCPHCKKSICFEDFKDKSSLKEFTISGLCQTCQDLTFK